MIALCDQRSFYASCEAVFRPDIRDKPIAVLSNNDGVVVALNEYAKAAGVKKFEPYFKQRELMERQGVQVFSSNYELIGEQSRRIMETLRALAPAEIEVYSIDEAFIDMTGLSSDGIKSLSRQLRDAVWQHQRIPVGVSVAPTKTLAKLGQYATKKIPTINGVCVLERPHQWQWLAERVAVEEVWGVGRRLTSKLNAIGVRSAADLSRLSEREAKAMQGVTLVRTVQELNGVGCLDIETAPPPKQQIICSRSFGQKITNLDDLKEAVSFFSCRAAEKLRGQESYAYRLSIWVQTSRFDSEPINAESAIEIPGGSDDSRRLSQVAIDLLQGMYYPGARYAKAGVTLNDLRPQLGYQLDWLEADSVGGGSEVVMGVMDRVNKRFGRGALTLGRQVGRHNYAMQRALKSPSYLTRFTDLPLIRMG